MKHCTTDKCPQILDSSCVFYEGTSLIFSGINTNDSVETVIQKLNLKLESIPTFNSNNYYTKNETYSKIEVDKLLDIIEVTKSELDDLVANSLLLENRIYKITGIESWYTHNQTTKAIYLVAESSNRLSTKGHGEFYVPKYNLSDAFYGIWKGEFLQNGVSPSGEITEIAPMVESPIYNIGDKVIWGGMVWKNITGNLGTNIYQYTLYGTTFTINRHNWLNADWELVNVNETDYNLQNCIIEYDYENDKIIYREDEFKNIVKISNNVIYNELSSNFTYNYVSELMSYANIIQTFQWGIRFQNIQRVNKGCINNLIDNSFVINCNHVGSFENNVFTNKSVYKENTFYKVRFTLNKIDNSYCITNKGNNFNFSSNTFEKSSEIVGNSFNGNLFFGDNIISSSYFIYNTFYPDVTISRNIIIQNSYIDSNIIKKGQLSYNNLNESSSIKNNKYYISIYNNKLSNYSLIHDNNDNDIIVNDINAEIKYNVLDDNSQISYNTFIEEGKEIDYTIKSIYKNTLIKNSLINSNTIKNGSTIFGNNLDYYSTINSNNLDTESNIYNNQLIQNGKIDNNILTGHGRIYGNQLDRQSEITNCKLRISPATSYASTIKGNRLFTGKIQNVDFGNIVNPIGSDPNNPAFGGNALSECIIENESIIKDLTFPNVGGVALQFIKMNGASEFKNITVNDNIRSVEFINTVFDETSDYSKIIQGASFGGLGFTKYYLDNILLQDRFDEKQDVLTEDNVGQFMDLELPTKLTPTSGDTVLGRDSLTGKAVEIPTSSLGGSGLALGETSSTAYRGDRGKTAYDHSQTTGNPHGTTKSDIGLGNVDNTSDLDKPISTLTLEALGLKANLAGYNVFTGSAEWAGNISVAQSIFASKIFSSTLTINGSYTDAQADLLDVGTIFYNSDQQCYMQKLSADVYHNFGSELPSLSKIGDNTNHLNGMPVYISSGAGNLKIVSLTNSTIGKADAMATQDVANSGNKTGFYCYFGGVNKFPRANVIKSTDDPATWIEGAELRLCSETGKLSTQIEPAPAKCPVVARITAVNGSNISVHFTPNKSFAVEDASNIDGDTTSIIDTDVILKKESGGLWKKISWANIKATLKNYFDNLYAPKSFNVKVTTPSSWVTGTMSETEVLRIEIPANSLSDSDVLNIPFLMINKVGTNGTIQIKGKLSTSPTMTFGSTDQLFQTIAVAANNQYIALDRQFIIEGGQIKGYPFTSGSTSGIGINSNQIASKPFDRTVTNYLYISIQLANSADQARLEGMQLTNS